MANTLIILSGLPGSGKSTLTKGYLKENFSDAIIIENDVLRRELNLGEGKSASKKLTAERNLLAEETFKTGKDLILDGVWSSFKARKAMYDLAKSYGYNVITFVVTASVETVLERQYTRPAEDKVPEEVILSMAKYYSLPEVGADCDELYHISTDESYNIDEANKELESFKHESTFHLESVGTHVKMVTTLVQDSEISDEEKDILIDVAKWHDIGKKYTKEKRFGAYSFIGHANVSVLEYLNNSNAGVVAKLNDTKEYFTATIISKHMVAHDNKDLKLDLNYNGSDAKELVLKFSEFDSQGSIATPIISLNQDLIDLKCRKYIFAFNYNPMSYYMGVKKVIEKFNLTKEEVGILVEETLKYFSMRSSIYDIKGNCLAQGLESFFNIGQFSWIEPEDNNSYEWQKLFIDLSTPVGKTKEYTKVDGSLIQIVNLNGEISVHSRGTFFRDLNFINVEGALEKVTKLAEELLDELNIELKTGEVVYAEMIGKAARIVLKYNVDLKLIPLMYINDEDTVRFDTSSSLELNEDTFDEGVIVVDENDRLFKSKTAEYFEAHKFLGKLFSEENLLDIYVNDTLDDFAHLYRTEEEMNVVLEIFKTLDEVFNYKGLSYHECKELNKVFEFNICKYMDNIDEFKNHYNDELFHYLIGNREILSEYKLSEKRNIIKSNKEDYLDEFNNAFKEDKFKYYKCLTSGRKQSPELIPFKSIIRNIIEESGIEESGIEERL